LEDEQLQLLTGLASPKFCWLLEQHGDAWYKRRLDGYDHNGLNWVFIDNPALLGRSCFRRIYRYRLCFTCRYFCSNFRLRCCTTICLRYRSERLW